MSNRWRFAACALAAVLAFGVTGCSSVGNAPEKIISEGYLPNKIANIGEGGEFDSSALTPHESDELPLEKLEGFWLYEGLADEGNSGESADEGSYAVADKTITLNEGIIECLPRSIDIRPYSPMKTLISQGFGYGAAVFQEVADDSDGLGSVMIQTTASLPYLGHGFICATNGSTLALGFLGAGSDMDKYGTVVDKEDEALDECTLTEIDYEASLDGGRLTLSYDGASATYIQQPTVVGQVHGYMWFGESLYEGNSPISILGARPINLLDKGYTLDFDLDRLLSSCAISEKFSIKTPGGTTLSAKLVNPYEKKVPAGYSKVCWYEYDGGQDGSLTIGAPSQYEQISASQEFGVSSYSDVYNHFELPYETSDNLLHYKVGYIPRTNEIITALGEGYDTGATALESDHSCDIRLGFENNVLSSMSVSDAVYMNAGLQDNITYDDLNELEPSVYREVTERRDTILEELKKAFKAAGLDVIINEKTGEVVIDNNVLFAKDSFELGAEGREYLAEVFSAYASVILDDKYTSALKEISFEGNTDSDGSSEYNMKLSEDRANSVMEYCSDLLDGKLKELFDELAACRGYGESDLVYDGNGNENKDASRRVAIKFMLSVDDLKAETDSQTDVDSPVNVSASSASSNPSNGSLVSNKEEALRGF